jgi:hypothetical protein
MILAPVGAYDPTSSLSPGAVAILHALGSTTSLPYRVPTYTPGLTQQYGFLSPVTHPLVRAWNAVTATDHLRNQQMNLAYGLTRAGVPGPDASSISQQVVYSPWLGPT